MPRPIRPKTARREGVSLSYHPASDKRIHTKYSREDIETFSHSVKDIPPKDR